VPPGPLWLLANEFLDTPVHQLVRTAGGWRERAVGLDADGGFVFVDGHPAPPDLLPAGDLPVGTLVERRPAAEAVVAAIARRIAVGGGRALIVDYGHAAGHGDTLQAVAEHGRVPVLEAPGTVDLSAHAALADLAAAARAAGAAAWGPVPQAASRRRWASSPAERWRPLPAAQDAAAALHR
jgi:SAM-dependent MidA family methyltransferase